MRSFLDDHKISKKYPINLEEKLIMHSIDYNSPVEEFVDGHPLGNGDIGAMVTGSPKSFKIYFNKSDIWDNRMPNDELEYPKIKYNELLKVVENKDIDKYNQLLKEAMIVGTGFSYPSPQPAGIVEIRFKNSDYRKYHQSLSIANGTEEITFFTDDGKYNLNFYIDNKYNVSQLNLDYKDKTPNQIEISIYRTPTDLYEKEKYFTDGKFIGFEFIFPDGFKFVNVLFINSDGLEIVKDNGNLFIKTQDKSFNKLEIVQTIVTSNESEDMIKLAKRRINDYLSIERSVGKEENDKWWNNFWGSSYIDLEDKLAEKIWYFGLYLMGSCSKEGKQAPGLQGLWSAEYHPAWRGDYYLDLNMEMYYWFVYTANHLELAEPFYSFLNKILPVVKEDTKFYYEVDGALFYGAGGWNGHGDVGYISGLFWKGSSAWVCSHLWKNYLYSEDEVFLKEAAYPIFYESIKFYNNILRKNENGKYIDYKSYSPEQMEGNMEGIGDNPTMDLFFIKELYKCFYETLKILKIDDKNIDKDHILDVINNISDYPMKDGHIIDMEGIEFNHSHRHASHLVPIYPGGEFNGYSSSLEKYNIGLNTLFAYLRRGNNSTRGYMGLTYLWLSCISSALGLKDFSISFLYEYMDSFVNDKNLLNMCFDYRKTGRGINADDIQSFSEGTLYKKFEERVFQLECNSCAIEAINLMLLQSFGGEITIFPSCFWKNASFEGLRAEGGFLISAEKKDGKIKSLFIKSLFGNECRLYLDNEIAEISIKDVTKQTEIKVNKIGPNEIKNKVKYVFETAENHEYEINLNGEQ